METKVVMSMKIKMTVMCLCCFMFLNCSALQKDTPIDKWLELEYIIDTRLDIKLFIPPAKLGTETVEPQFFSTSTDSYETILFASYDPGWGKNRDLLLSRIASSIKRIEIEPSLEPNTSLKYLKNEVYLSRANAAEEFDIVGEVNFNEHPWLRVNLIGGYRRGISYATIVDGQYILLVSMSIFGEDSDKTRLFETRHETLKKVVNSIRFSTS